MGKFRIWLVKLTEILHKCRKLRVKEIQKYFLNTTFIIICLLTYFKYIHVVFTEIFRHIVHDFTEKFGNVYILAWFENSATDDFASRSSISVNILSFTPTSLFSFSLSWVFSFSSFDLKRAIRMTLKRFCNIIL